MPSKSTIISGTAFVSLLLLAMAAYNQNSKSAAQCSPNSQTQHVPQSHPNDNGNLSAKRFHHIWKNCKRSKLNHHHTNLFWTSWMMCSTAIFQSLFAFWFFRMSRRHSTSDVIAVSEHNLSSPCVFCADFVEANAPMISPSAFQIDMHGNKVVSWFVEILHELIFRCPKQTRLVAMWCISQPQVEIFHILKIVAMESKYTIVYQVEKPELGRRIVKKFVQFCVFIISATKQSRRNVCVNKRFQVTFAGTFSIALWYINTTKSPDVSFKEICIVAKHKPPEFHSASKILLSQ